MDSVELIASIYDHAVAADGLEPLAELLTTLVEGEQGMLGLARNGVVFDGAAFNHAPEALAQYAAHYTFINPLDRLIRTRRDIVVARDCDLIEETTYRRTEFYNDFAKVHDSARIMGTPIIPISSGVAAHVGIHRPASSKQFTRFHTSKLERAIAHLQRALQLRSRIGPWLSKGVGLDAIQNLPLPAVVCDQNCAVLFANSAAELIANESLGLRLAGPDGIAAALPEESARLRKLVNETARRSAGGRVVLRTPSGRRLVALVTALPRRMGDHPGHCLITIRSTAGEVQAERLVPTLTSLFGLTAAEARLATSLLSGRSLGETRTVTGVTANTLRTQLKSIFRKTEVASQRDLVLLVSMLD